MDIFARKNYLNSKNGIHHCYDSDVIYDNEFNLRLQILFPYSCTYQDKFPCLLYVQGSGWDVQPLYSELCNLYKIAQRGYVIALVEYRDAFKAPFPNQIIDCKTAIRFMKKHAKHYNVDENNIFLSGSSSGAHTAIMVELTRDDRMFDCNKYPDYDDEVRGIINWYAPTNMNLLKEHSQHPIFQVLKGDMDDLYFTDKVTPLNYVKPNLKPFLIFHGTNDSLVSIESSELLYEKLKKNNNEVTFIRMIDSDHGGPEFFTEEVIDIIDRFLKNNLK